MSNVDEPETQTASGAKRVLKNKAAGQSSLHTRLVAGGIALVLIVGAVIGIAVFTSLIQPAEDQKTSVPVDKFADEPGNSVTPEYFITAESMNIPVGLSPEEYGKAFFDRLNTWELSGATQQTYDDWQESGYSDDIPERESKYAASAVRQSSMFSQVSIDATIESTLRLYQERHLQILQDWLLTYNEPGAEPNKDNAEAFKTTLDLDSATLVKENESGRVLIITGIEHNNAERNSFYNKEAEANGRRFSLRVTTVYEDGNEVIVSAPVNPL